MVSVYLKFVKFVLATHCHVSFQFLGASQVSCFDRVWESDILLDWRATQDLKELLGKFKSSALRSEDGTVSYLLDHMSYPLVYNRTLVSGLNGKTLRPIAPLFNDLLTVSPHFALLPSDVSVSSGSAIEFLSYINNLHPDFHHGIYQHLESLLAGFIPLFEHTLTDLHRNNPSMQRIPGNCRYTIWEEPEPPEHSDDEEGWITYESDMRNWALNRPIDLPDIPDTGYPGGLETRRHVVSLRNRKIQVITAAFEISLVSKEIESFICDSDHCVQHPQGPTFDGTPWHVEGTRSERIVACGFHCLSAVSLTSVAILSIEKFYVFTGKYHSEPLEL